MPTLLTECLSPEKGKAKTYRKKQKEDKLTLIECIRYESIHHHSKGKLTDKISWCQTVMIIVDPGAYSGSGARFFFEELFHQTDRGC